MIYIGKHAVHKTAQGIVGIAGFIGFHMMHMMGNHIDFLGKRFDHQVLCEQPENRMAELIRFVRTETVKPDGSVRAHDYHRVNHQHNG